MAELGTLNLALRFRPPIYAVEGVAGISYARRRQAIQKRDHSEARCVFGNYTNLEKNMLESEITKKFGNDKAQLQHAIEDLVDDGVSLGKARLENITSSVEDAYVTAIKKTRETAHEVQNKAEDTFSRAAQFYQTQPLVMLGAFMAMGAIVAAVMISNATSPKRTAPN
jgi:ElaB/YqjD/DUF883 family membrane-anchored ribosome-binding protein